MPEYIFKTSGYCPEKILNVWKLTDPITIFGHMIFTIIFATIFVIWLTLVFNRFYVISRYVFTCRKAYCYVSSIIISTTILYYIGVYVFNLWVLRKWIYQISYCGLKVDGVAIYTIHILIVLLVNSVGLILLEHRIKSTIYDPRISGLVVSKIYRLIIDQLSIVVHVVIIALVWIFNTIPWYISIRISLTTTFIGITACMLVHLFALFIWNIIKKYCQCLKNDKSKIYTLCNAFDAFNPERSFNLNVDKITSELYAVKNLPEKKSSHRIDNIQVTVQNDELDIYMMSNTFYDSCIGNPIYWNGDQIVTNFDTENDSPVMNSSRQIKVQATVHNAPSPIDHAMPSTSYDTASTSCHIENTISQFTAQCMENDILYV